MSKYVMTKLTEMTKLCEINTFVIIVIFVIGFSTKIL